MSKYFFHKYAVTEDLKRGNFIETIIGDLGQYPYNGLHHDNYWYVMGHSVDSNNNVDNADNDIMFSIKAVEPLSKPVIVGYSTANGYGSTIRLNIPTQTQENDMAIAFISMDSDNNTVNNTNANFIQVGSEYNRTGHIAAQIWYKVINNNDIQRGYIDFNILQDEYTATLVIIRGADLTSPIKAIKSSRDNTAPQITNLASPANHLLFTHYTTHSSQTFTTPSDMKTLSSIQHTNYASSLVAYEYLTEEGMKNSKVASGAAANYSCVSFSIIITPGVSATNQPSQLSNNIIQFVGKTTSNITSENYIDLTTPNNTQVGDVMIAFISLDGNNTRVTSAPQNWVKLLATSHNNSHIAAEIWYKVATMGDLNTTHRFSLNVSEESTATLATFRNVDTSSPIGNYNSLINSGTTNTGVAPSINISKNGNLLITHFTSHGSSSFTTPSGMSLIASLVNPYYATSLISYEQVQAGQSGTRIAGTSSATIPTIGISIELKQKNIAPSQPSQFTQPIREVEKGSTINISWANSIDLNGDTVKYKLEYKYDNNNWITLVTSTNNNYYNGFQVNNGNESYLKFRVRAEDDYGNYSNWTESQAIRLVAPNIPPNDVPRFISPIEQKLNKGSTYSISWEHATDQNGDPVSYKLEVQFANGNYTEIAATINSNSINYTIPINAAGNTIRFRVRAVDSKGTFSNYTYSNTFILNNAPNAPSKFTKPTSDFLIRGDTYEITWESANDADFDNLTYDVEYSYDNQNYALIVKDTNNLSIQWTAPNSTSYKNVWFRVRTKDSNGAYSNYTVSKAYNLNSKPNKPVWSQPTANTILRPSKPIKLSWSTSDSDNDTLTYDVFVSYKNNNFTKIASDLSKAEYDYTVDSSFISGDVIFQVIAKDSKGLYSDICVSPIFKSQAGPGAPIINLSPSSWTSGTVTVTIVDGNNTGGGIFGSQYRINGADWTSYVSPFTITQEGITKIEARTLDDSMYSSDISVKEAKIDKTKPNAPQLSLSHNDWTSSNVTIYIISNSDNQGGSGILKHEYKLNNGPWETYDPSKATIQSEGVIEVFARSVDMAGNTSDIVKATAKIDKTKPTTPTIILDNENWTKSNVTFTLNPGTDTLSGINRVEYKINNGEWSTYTGRVTITNDGYNSIYARTIDNAGNISNEAYAVAKIDKSPPTDPKINLSNIGWTNKDVSFTIDHGVDPLSGVKVTEFQIDGGPWKEYKGTYIVSKEGLTSVSARTIDNLGNVSNIVSTTIKIDKTKPPAPTITLSSNNWTKEDVTVTINNNGDTLSGIERIEYRLENENQWHIYSPPLVMSKSGEYKIFARAIDNASNISNESYATIKIDKNGPSAPIIELSENNWTNKDVIVFLSANNDSLSGISSIEYKVGTNNSWSTYYGPFTINVEGQTTIYARTINNVGNISNTVTAVVKIDKTKPSKPSISVNNSNWTTNNVTVTINNGNDTLSGVKETQYKIGPNGIWNKYTGPVTINSEGAITIYAKTIDNAGNESDYVYAISRIDKSKPTGDIILNDGNGSVNGATKTVKVTLKGYDYGSGVTHYMISRNSDFTGATWELLNNKVVTILRTTRDLYTEIGNITNTNQFSRFFNEKEAKVTYHSTMILEHIDWSGTLTTSISGDYSIEHIAYFTPKESGTYSFGISAGDSAELWINNTLVTSIYNNNSMSTGFMQTGNINLNANTEYKIVFKTIKRSTNNGGGRLGIKAPSDSSMYVAPPELFFKSPVVHTIENWDLGSNLGMVTVYAKFKDLVGNISDRYSSGIMRNSYPTGKIISPISQTGYLINQRPKIVVQFNDTDGDIVIDFKIQISDVANFSSILLEDNATSAGTGWQSLSSASSGKIIYTPKIDLGYGTKYFRVALKDQYGWGAWSETVEVEIRNPNWTDTILSNYTGVKTKWVEELREKMYAIKACRGMGYYQTFKSKNFPINGLTINSRNPFKVTSTDTNCYIDMYNIGVFSPSKYRYFIVKYRVVGGTPTQDPCLYFCDNEYPNFDNITPPSDHKIIIPINADGNWHTVYVDAWKNELWKKNGSINGWRLVIAEKAELTFEIEYIALVENLTDINTQNIINDITPIRYLHLTELRSAFEEIMKELNETVTWTDSIIKPEITERKGIHWIELRNIAEKS